MRQIILDTETTGLDPHSGHRVTEIGCVEVINLIPTGTVFHRYINPERDVPPEAFAISGLSYEFLKNHKVFSEVIDDFIAFIGEDSIVIHNAGFDMKFLNYEFKLLDRPLINPHRIIDTLMMARKKFPGSPASLDALCRRFRIDNAHRVKHGALLDATLLADVYLQLMGGKQPILYTESQKEKRQESLAIVRRSMPQRSFHVGNQDFQNHQSFVQSIKSALWTKSL